MSGDKKAWIYSRLASVAIDDNSLQQQEDALHSFATDNGYEIVGKTAETESGNNFDRAGLKELLDNAANYDYLIMRDATRIGRDMIRAKKFIGLLQDKGVTIVTLDDSI